MSTQPTPRARIDVLIPTLNEAIHIREAVENALTVGPVFVLDSLSTDGTQQLAREAGATVVEHGFEGYARQKNWGLSNLPFTGDWVFILDADERITPQLRRELFRVAGDARSGDGYFVNRVVIFMGRAIRHGGLYPSWNLRFFRRGRARYEDRTVHEHMICDGPTDYLREEMLHIRRESVWEWIRKHVRYADLESDEWVKLRLGKTTSGDPGQMFKKTLRHRVRWYIRRELWPLMPFKGTFRFLYMYFLRLGVLDGLAGWHLALFMAGYENMITLMFHEKFFRLRVRGGGTEPEMPPGVRHVPRAPSEPR